MGVDGVVGGFAKSADHDFGATFVGGGAVAGFGRGAGSV